jgi:hypothetical protein
MVNRSKPRAPTVLVLMACLAVMLAGSAACAGTTSTTGTSGSGPTSAGTGTTSGAGSTSGTGTTSGSTTTGSDGTSGTGTTGTTPPAPAPGTTKAGALFSNYTDAKGKYTVLVPGGWIKRPVPVGVLFARFGSTEAIRIDPRPTPATTKSVDATLASQKTLGKALHPDKAHVIKFGNGRSAIVVDFQRKPPKPQPGGPTLLNVREYVINGKKKAALLFLTSPDGVQNRVAYDLIASSFHWQ